MLRTLLLFSVVGLSAVFTGCSDRDPPSGQAPGNSSFEGPPNFLVIHVDDVDFDELGVYWEHEDPRVRELPSFTRAERLDLPHLGARGQTLGYEEVGAMSTPNIDSLAEEGMLFTRYYVTSPVCTPSRFSMMTGRYASRSQALRDETPSGEPPLIAFNTPLEGEKTLPMLLRERGYTTGLAGKWHNFGGEDSLRGNGRLGNYTEADPEDPAIKQALLESYQRRVDELRSGAGFDWVDALYPGNVEEIGIPRSLYREARHNVEWINAAARDFLETNADRPFLLYLAHTAPHGWMGSIGQEEHRRLTPKGVLDAAPEVAMPSRADVYRRVREAGHGRPMAVSLDDSVGELLEVLRELGIDDRTVIIFTSDHGNRGKESVYEAARSPLLVRWPGHIVPGSVSHALVSNIDVAPTILALAGAAPAVDMDGLDMSPAWRDDKERIRDALMLEMSVSRAVVTEDWKYIAHRPPQEIARRMAAESELPAEERLHGWDGNWQRTASGEWRQSQRISYRNHMFFPAYFDLDQLYDLQSDNMEQVNLASSGEHAEKLSQLQQLLADFLDETDQPVDWYFPSGLETTPD